MCIGHTVATVTRRLSWLVVVVLLSQSGRLAAEDVATLSFSAGSAGTFPASIKAGKTIEADLSALPKKATIIRAVLRPGRDEREASQDRLMPVKVVVRDGEPLPLLAPRFTTFDATVAVKQAREGGRDRIIFEVVSLSAYRPADTRLDITCSSKAVHDVPRVINLRARHRAGQTILTFSEVGESTIAAELTWKDWKALQAKLARERSPIRYRIYRGSEPITPATIAKAELIDDVGLLSCWNHAYSGEGAKDSDRLRRYVVEDGGQPVAPGIGIYAHNPKAAGKGYYAVSVAVNGEENLSAFDAGNSTREAMDEIVGLGDPILQRIERPKSFNYVDGPTLRYYVRWESWPNCNRPSSPYDYLVAVPANVKEPAPVGLHLHCWGGNLDGGYGWWYNAGAGAMLISTNQIPYDWWTGYHENLGTWKPWSQGVVRDFTQTRILSFLDWASGKWKIDRQRIFTAGSSMGGSGSPNFGIRHADRIAWVVSWVGVHTPARSPQFKGSYEQVYGNLEWKLPFADAKTPAFSYFDDEWFLRQNPAAEMPLICFSNGKNDGAIGWPQARDFWIALQETRRPHVFVWGQAGHGQRALLPGPKNGERELGVDVRLDRTLPAFTHCSLDENPGSGDPTDGDPQGQSNLYLYWESTDEAIIDRPGTWSMVLRLNDSAPKGPCTVDVTPRRCQQFKAPAGAALTWRNVSVADGKTIQEGDIKADEWGLATVPGVLVGKKGNRLTIAVPGRAEGVPGPAPRTAPQEPRSGQPPKSLAGLRADGKGAPGSDVFGLTRVHRLHLALSAKEWEAMQNTKGGMGPGIPGGPDRTAAEKQQGQRDIHLTDFIEFPWAHADLTEDGQTYRNVGVRYKGNFTHMASTRQLKRPLKLEFDHYDKDAPRFHGLRKFNLHASVLDPTRIHEVLSYAVFRAAGVAAPRTALAEITLTVPGKYDREFVGLFTLAEQVDKQFLKDRFGNDRGLLMKPQLRGPDYLGEGWEEYDRRYRPHREPTSEESRRVIEFAKLVNNADDEQFRRRIGSDLDIDAFLRFLAANALVVNLDSPLAMPHNYYIYLDARTGKFIFFPWDLDLGLAAWPMGGPPEQQMNLSLLHPHVGEHRLIDRLLAIPSVKEQYLKLLGELAAGSFSKETLLEAVGAIEQATKDPLAREADAAVARNERGVSSGFGLPGGGKHAPDPRTFVEKRTESVQAQLAGTSSGYIPVAGFGRPKPGGPPRPGMPEAKPPPASLQAKMQKFQAAVQRWQEQNRDLSPVGQIMQEFQPLMKEEEFEEAEAMLDRTLKLLGQEK